MLLGGGSCILIRSTSQIKVGFESRKGHFSKKGRYFRLQIRTITVQWQDFEKSVPGSAMLMAKSLIEW